MTSEQLRGEGQHGDRRRVVGYEAPFDGALADVPVGSSVDNMNFATAKCSCVVFVHTCCASIYCIFYRTFCALQSSDLRGKLGTNQGCVCFSRQECESPADISRCSFHLSARMRVGLRLVSNLPQLHAHSAYLRFALRRKFACENVRTTVERFWVLSYI